AKCQIFRALRSSDKEKIYPTRTLIRIPERGVSYVRVSILCIFRYQAEQVSQSRARRGQNLVRPPSRCAVQVTTEEQGGSSPAGTLICPAVDQLEQEPGALFTC